MTIQNSIHSESILKNENEIKEFSDQRKAREHLNGQ